MKLRELLTSGDVRRIVGDEEVEITGLSCDSRRVGPGALFFSLARDGSARRGHVEDALGRGARAVVVGGSGDVEARPAVTLVECDRPRLLMGAAASRFYAAPSERVDVLGVTGTSGKTTTTYLLASIFEAAGRSCGIIGTIGTFVRGRKIYSGLTTPESLDIERALAEMERSAVTCAATEVSSIGLAEGRVDQMNFRAALFTNFGRDHLDYHGTLEDYFAAKLRLFTEILPKSCHRDAFAVARGDDPDGRRVLDAVRGRKVSFGLARGFDVYPESFTADVSGIRATINAFGRRFEITSPLIGEFNLLNILGASALSVALGVDGAAVVDGVRRCAGAPGRLEAVAVRRDVTVLVDYAHKPDALEAVLTMLRGLAKGRVICVFGCGGDRDRGKRPLMGEIAGRLADVAVLTSDNPRTEDPLKIIDDVEQGLKHTALKRRASAAHGVAGYVVEPDRRAAIAIALRTAAPGDIVVIAGKGHEDYQLVGKRVLKFDDRAVVREIAAELGQRQC
ncbi:MAG: UDP-N-acetylmuramoyl-L-alanyl-D-glutamate--2,6-diaminopimelate ligase [Candidatus Binataceae bacterium]